MEMMDSLSNNTCQPKNPTQKVKQFDGYVIATQFIEYFYKTWLTDLKSFISDDIIKPFSKLKYNSTVYEGNDFLSLLATFVSENLRFENCTFEILDSGSRQVYILVNGQIKNNLVTKTFTQSFLISFAGDTKKSARKWTLMNSLLIIN
jgi:hypothetical protein